MALRKGGKKNSALLLRAPTEKETKSHDHIKDSTIIRLINVHVASKFLSIYTCIIVVILNGWGLKCKKKLTDLRNFLDTM